MRFVITVTINIMSVNPTTNHLNHLRVLLLQNFYNPTTYQSKHCEGDTGSSNQGERNIARPPLYQTWTSKASHGLVSMIDINIQSPHRKDENICHTPNGCFRAPLSSASIQECCLTIQDNLQKYKPPRTRQADGNKVLRNNKNINEPR